MPARQQPLEARWPMAEAHLDDGEPNANNNLGHAAKAHTGKGAASSKAKPKRSGGKWPRTPPPAPAGTKRPKMGKLADGELPLRPTRAGVSEARQCVVCDHRRRPSLFVRLSPCSHGDFCLTCLEETAGSDPGAFPSAPCAAGDSTDTFVCPSGWASRWWGHWGGLE